ncbi:MAG: HAD-IA family hydrolase [Candidatus Amulumruptor caecigallinarius]|nr:HAD-IA family hydrolase [Candidatus Amulumruptor caecigallinarius]MCM1396153.1 HAD-IA family hydrolase [Candidatus Amulumruptor caecigallinarius]MCM1453847.1 HAD-IA family hydrolase [bacterium]
MKGANGQEITCVWLDLDDTLVDFKSASRAALAKVYAEERLHRFFPSLQSWTSAYEKFNYELWQRYAGKEVDQATLRMERFRLPLMQADVARDIATAMSTRLDPVYLGYLADESRLLPGALELVSWLRDVACVKVGVMSNGFAEVQQRKLEVTGLDDMIDLMVLSDDIGINKPDPRLYEYAMERAGESAPAAQLMIGDNVNTDIAGALAAGWQALLFDPELPLLHTRGTGYPIVSTLEVIPTLFN